VPRENIQMMKANYNLDFYNHTYFEQAQNISRAGIFEDHAAIS